MDIGKQQKEFSKAIEHLKLELKSLRGGRATPALVENILVDCYGTKTPLKQIASIHTPEPKLIVIEPWDKSILKEVEKSINDAKVNFTANNDGQVVRIQIPPMTEEGRREVIKILNQKLEDARISVRKIREEIMKQLKSQKEESVIGEDEYFKSQKKVQEEVDGYNEEIKELGDAKEKEIMTV